MKLKSVLIRAFLGKGRVFGGYDYLTEFIRKGVRDLSVPGP